MNTAYHIKASELSNELIQTIKKTFKTNNIVVLPETDYNMLKDRHNAEYLAKLDKSFQQLSEGKVIVKTMDELEKMAT
jgi:hypothetical protein